MAINMRRTLAIFLLLCTTASLFSIDYQTLAEDTAWRALLEFDAEKDKSRITDPDFFASGYPTTPRTEAQYLIEHQSDEMIARFPARYNYLAIHYGLAVDVKQNKEVQEFIDNYGGEKISIVFFTPYMGSIMSYFGHDALKITKDADPDNAYLFNFMGNVTAFGQLSTYFKALTGKLPGAYTFVHLPDIYYKYQIRERRNIVEYPLNLTKGEIEQFLYAMKELVGITVTYKFFNDNCASGIVKLMESVFPNSRFKYDWMLFPLDAALTAENAGIANSYTFSHSMIETAVEQYEELSGDEKRLFWRFLKSDDKQSFDEACLQGNPKRDEIISLASYNYTLSYSKPKRRDAGLASLEGIAFTPVKGQRDFYHLQSLQSMVDLTYTLKDGKSKVFLGYRPKYSDRDQMLYSRIFDSKKEAWTLKVSFSEDHPIWLEQFYFLDFASYNKLNRFKNSSSWEVATGADRLFEHDSLCWFEKAGFGISAGNDHFFLTIIPTLMIINYPFSVGGLVHAKAEIITKHVKFGCVLSQNIYFTAIKRNNSYRVYALARILDNHLQFETGYDFARKEFTLSSRYYY